MHTTYRRFFVSGQAAAALRRDGFGWDHGMECVVLPCERKRWFLMGIFNFKKDNKMSRLEHVNITVSNPKSTAKMLGHLFGWHVRWEGPAMGALDTRYMWGAKIVMLRCIPALANKLCPRLTQVTQHAVR